MRSDPAELDGKTFDFMVVGGGIQGAAIARELALRSSSVVLVEKEDFGSGSSMRSSRMINAGIPCLGQARLAQVREDLAERHRLLMTAPHLVRPQPVLMPFYRDSSSWPAWRVRLGLRLQSWLSRAGTLPGPAFHTPDDCRRIFPGLRSSGLGGGTLYFDAACEDLPLTLAVLKSAQESGAILVNHFELSGAQGECLILRDRIFDREMRLRAKTIVNAAGAAVDRVRSSLGLDGTQLTQVRRASHLLFAGRESETGLVVCLPDGQPRYLIPHPDGTLCGATDVPSAASSEGSGVTAEDVDHLLQVLASLLEVAPDRSQIQFAYAGLYSGPAGRASKPGFGSETAVVDESWSGGSLHSIVGGNLSTHRSFAERTVNRLLGRSDPSPSRDQRLPGGEGLQDPGDPLWWRYGSRAVSLRKMARGQPELMQPFAPDRDHLGIEAVYAMRELGALTFTDLMLRRLFHRLGPCMEAESLRRMHELYLRERPLEFPADFESDRQELTKAIRDLQGESAGVSRQDSEVQGA